MAASTKIGSVAQFVPETDDWRIYEKQVKFYLLANNIPETRKAPTLLTLVGPVALQTLIDLLTPEDLEDKTYEELLTALRNHYAKKVTKTGSRVV